jgi:hypothetical protein
LLLLNHERHAEEVAVGLVDESGKPLKAKAKGTKTKGASGAGEAGQGADASLASYWTALAAMGRAVRVLRLRQMIWACGSRRKTL